MDLSVDMGLGPHSYIYDDELHYLINQLVISEEIILNGWKLYDYFPLYCIGGDDRTKVILSQRVMLKNEISSDRVVILDITDEFALTGKNLGTHFDVDLSTSDGEIVYYGVLYDDEDGYYTRLFQLVDHIMKFGKGWREATKLKDSDSAERLRKACRSEPHRNHAFIEQMCKLIEDGRIDTIHFYNRK